jgi:plasmid rolling circle replication initiator protein Rep
MNDPVFSNRVDLNQVAFAKGDILLCDARVTQKRTAEGLKTEYVVEQVVEHRPAVRQLPLPLDNS